MKHLIRAGTRYSFIVALLRHSVQQLLSRSDNRQPVQTSLRDKRDRIREVFRSWSEATCPESSMEGQYSDTEDPQGTGEHDCSEACYQFTAARL